MGESSRPFGVLRGAATAAREILATITEDQIRSDQATRRVIRNIIRGEKLIFSAIDEWLRDLDRQQGTQSKVLPGPGGNDASSARN
jgi:precorrin-4 methylase